MYIHCYCTSIFVSVCGAVLDRVNLSISFSFVNNYYYFYDPCISDHSMVYGVMKEEAVYHL